jgi:hypothetical protein
MMCLPPLCAQTGNAPAPNAAANPAPSGQAPDNMTAKITELVHARKYTEAQQLTAGLLIAYPNDQRLIKAKALIEKLLAPGGSTNADPTNSQPAQAAANTNTELLTGMDKVDYNALIVLARQAQQTTDRTEQEKQLQQFMNQSNSFLQKHPDQMLLWQLRVASAISLNDPTAGYDAGQKLLAAGAADSNDPGLQGLLGQLKNKGWLDKQEAEKQAERKMDYLSILGTTWDGHVSRANRKGREIAHFDWTMEFSEANSVIEGYITPRNGKKEETPLLRGTILDSGEISWEHRSDSPPPPHWFPVQVHMGDAHRTMQFVFTGTARINVNAFNTNGSPELCTQTTTLTKSLRDRATDALKKADQASKLEKEPGKSEQAEALIRQAAAEYPEMPKLAASIPYFEGMTAFYRRDYDRLLAISEDLWKTQPSFETAGALAGALSCKYAATGDTAFRQRAQEMMDKARQLAQGNNQAEQRYQEYAERIKYRLDTREIIDKQEYDRRFRGGQQTK